MIMIVGTALYQWDTGRYVTTDIEADHIHFSNKGDSKAVIMDIVDSQAKIPDYLLQTGKQLCVYVVRNGVTVESRVFSVTPRERPEDYIYEEDQRNFVYELIADAQAATKAANQAAKEAADVSDAIKEDAASGKFKGDKGDQGEKGDPGEQGPKGDKGDPGTALIDNSVVGDSAWSSKNTVDKLCPSFTESGGVAVCEPLEGYPLEVISEIAEKDDGSAWNAITLTRCGKNLFDFSQGVYRVSFVVDKQLDYYGYILDLPPGQYAVHAKRKYGTVGRYIFCSVINVDGVRVGNAFTPIKGTENTVVCPTISAGEKLYVYCGNIGADKLTATNTFAEYEVQIEAGSVATDYEPYRDGGELSVDFANLGPEVLVHFGSYNWRTGVLDTEENGVFQHDPEKGTFTEIEDLSAYVPPIVRNIPAMSGTNCFYSNCGTTQVTGKSDPVKIIEKLTNVILAQGGTV